MTEAALRMTRKKLPLPDGVLARGRFHAEAVTLPILEQDARRTSEQRGAARGTLALAGQHALTNPQHLHLAPDAIHATEPGIGHAQLLARLREHEVARRLARRGDRQNFVRHAAGKNRA